MNPMQDDANIDFIRRHSRWYERILLSYLFQFVTGGLFLIACCAVPIWGLEFWKSEDPNLVTSLLASLFAFFVSTFSLRRLFRLPDSESVAYIIPITFICYLIPIGLILFFRTSYSIQIFFVGFGVTLCWCFAGFFIGRRYRLIRYAILPFGRSKELQENHGALFKILNKPDLDGERFNAVVADFDSPNITPDWETFLAKCTLARIPVYSEKKIRESITGRVQINHLSENIFGSLLPSQFYEFIKRWIDILSTLIFIPFLIPVFVIIFILIRLESKGSPFFIQTRMGYRGKLFPMLKFRSMYIDKRGSGYTNPTDDPRITKVGRVIRKFRIDELPQVFNILIGHMSFIGPRPESFELSKWYEKDVPFFSYRHVVRPGLSGWAQVNQGYAAEVDGMKIKLEYDFYYIKNFSFWLDLLITFKTIKTILTGFGAR
jgi:lipopolysaccharide/colanic/teichoic acid biosynthesis glycosyltransferase